MVSTDLAFKLNSVIRTITFITSDLTELAEFRIMDLETRLNELKVLDYELTTSKSKVSASTLDSR